MGEIVATGNGESDKDIEQKTGTETGTGRSTENKSAGDTRTGDTGGRTGGRTGGTAGGNETEKEIVSGLALLTEEEQKQYQTADDAEKKRLIRNAKRRERYKKEKASGGQTVKPRKVNKAKKNEPTLDTASLNMIFATVSSVVASRPGMEHWLLTEKEIESITKPLAKMLAESNALTYMGQYSNQIALVMACITVFMPRVIVTLQKQKEVKKVNVTGQHTDTNVKSISGGTGRNLKQEKDSNNKSTGRNERTATNPGGDTTSNVPWYGQPISG